MIVYLTRGTTRLALRIRETNTSSQLTSWKDLQLLIQPGQYDQCCGPNGSPWILTGCWPGKPTGVDIANPAPFDFPTLVYPSFALDNDGRVVFALDERLWRLPNGRYSGVLQLATPIQPFNMKPLLPHGEPEENGVIIPDEFLIGRECYHEPACPPPKPPKPKHCVLAVFDIDMGPECSDHMVDQIAVDFAIGCGVDDGNS